MIKTSKWTLLFTDMGFKNKPKLRLYFSMKKGISLIEIITVSAIIGIIGMMAAAIYFAQFRLFSNQNTAIDINTQNKIALSEITNYIRQSESIVANCSDCGSDTTGTNTIILRLWSIDSAGEPIDPGGTNYDYLVYKRGSSDNTQLVRITYPFGSSVRPSGSKVIAISIGDLQFTYNDPTPANASQVTISLTTTATTGNKTQTQTDTAKVELRNK